MSKYKDYKPGFLESIFNSDKIAKKILKEDILPRLKKYPKKYSPKQELTNVLHVNTAAGKGGAAKIAHELLNLSLNKKCYNSKIITNEAYVEDNSIIELEHKNKKLHKLLHKYQKRNGLIDFFNLDSFNIQEMQAFKDADILHLHNLHGNYFSLFNLPEITSLKPTIWTLHDEYAFTGHCSFTLDCEKWLTGCEKCTNLGFYPKLKKDTANYLFEIKKKIYEASDFTIVCYSNWLKSKLCKSMLKNKDIRLIYNGIDEKTFVNTPKPYARKQLNLPLDKKILLFSANGGVKNPQKGGEYVLEAYKYFKDRKDLLFICIGGHKPVIKAPNWLDVPYINDERTMALYYSASDLFIYPSLSETFGLVIAEAMACELPVVTFRNTAIPEVVGSDECGYIAENKNTQDFVNGIKLYLDNDNLRKKAGVRARKRVLEKFTLDRMVNEYKNLYEEKLGK